MFRPEHLAHNKTGFMPYRPFICKRASVRRWFAAGASIGMGALMGLHSALAIPIYTDGVERAIVVVPDQSSPATLYAAKELQKHLNAVTRASFKIKKESELIPNEAAKPIYVGDTVAARKKGIPVDSLEKNEFAVWSAPEALYLVGKDDPTAEAPVDDRLAMGSVLAVYDWLDRTVGVRWLWPGEGGTVIPRLGKLVAEEGPMVKGKPAYSYMSLRLYFRYHVKGKPSRYGRSDSLQDRSFEANSEWMLRHKILRTSGADNYYGHGFGDYWQRFGKEHPEFFALRADGQRGPVDTRTYLTQMCVSNPELHKAIVKDWLATRTPESPWINACENDRRVIDPFCMCEVCRSWDVPEAKIAVQDNPWHIDSRPKEKIDPYESVSMSDRYARFLLEVLAEAKKHDPNAKVVGYAYSSYSDPPVNVKLNSDVIIIVVPPYIYPLDKGKEGTVRKLWDDWKATGAQLAYRPNDFLVGFTLPYIYPTQLGRDLKHFMDNGMIAVDLDSTLGMWGTQGVSIYLTARMLDRPDLSVEEILAEYYGAFGKAKDIVQEYTTYWEGVTAKCDTNFQKAINGGWGVMMNAGHKIFTPDTYKKGFEILARADEATKDDKVTNQRIAFLRVWLEHAELCTQAIEVYQSINPSSPTDDDKARLNLVLNRLHKFREDNEKFLIGANWLFLQRNEPWRNWKG